MSGDYVMVRTSLIRWVKHLADQFFVTDSINFRSYFLTSVCFSYSMPLWHGIRGKLHKAQVQGCLWTVRGRWTKCETDVWFINYWVYKPGLVRRDRIYPTSGATLLSGKSGQIY